MADQNFKYQNRIKRKTPAFASIHIGSDLVHIRTEDFKIHTPEKHFQMLTQPAQSGKLLFNIKETALFHIAIPSIKTEEMETQRGLQNQEVFRTLHLATTLWKTGMFERILVNHHAQWGKFLIGKCFRAYPSTIG